MRCYAISQTVWQFKNFSVTQIFREVIHYTFSVFRQLKIQMQMKL